MFCYKKNIFCLLILVFFLSSCKPPPPPEKDFSKLNWLIGTWEVDNGKEYETWTKLNDSTFFGRNFKVYHKTDTLIAKNTELRKRGNEILYVPTIKTPKGDRLVEYKMISDSENYFVFKNPENRFPIKITYTKLDHTTAKTLLEDGKRKLKYNYKRQK